MNANDGGIPHGVSWADFCDALAVESLLKFQRRRFQDPMPASTNAKNPDVAPSPVAIETADHVAG
jgi:hypothetical protein